MLQELLVGNQSDQTITAMTEANEQRLREQRNVVERVRARSCRSTAKIPRSCSTR